MSSGDFIGDDLATLKTALEHDKLRRKKERDQLIEAVKRPPLTDADLRRLIRLGPGDWNEVMRHHPGHVVEEVLSSLRNTFDVFSRAWKDLTIELRRFSDFAAAPDAMYKSRQNELQDITSAVRKEVFTLSTAAKALVDVSRRLEARVSIPGYRERIDFDFADNGQHRFVIKLRDTLNHGWFAPADWRMSHGPEGRSTAFTLCCADLLHNGDFTGTARTYILKAGEWMDIRELFSSYVAKVSNLYDWLWSVVDEHLDPSTLEYRYCTRERNVNMARSMWNLLLQIVGDRKVDPYSYLHMYLTKREATEILKLPPRSKVQVDRIILLVDEHGACDDQLRKKVYSLFGVIG